MMIREEVKAAGEQEDLKRKCVFFSFSFFCSGSKGVMNAEGVGM